MLHDCYAGYHLPCEFEHLVLVEPYGSPASTSYRAVGSSYRLMRKLQGVNEHLCVPEEYPWDASDPLARVKEAFAQMRDVVKLSCDHGLPIVFYG